MAPTSAWLLSTKARAVLNEEATDAGRERRHEAQLQENWLRGSAFGELFSRPLGNYPGPGILLGLTMFSGGLVERTC